VIQPVYGRSPEVAAFVAGLIPGCERGFGECVAIGFERDGQLVAGVVYHNWNPPGAVIELSSAALDRAWTNKSVIQTIYGYPFDQIGCQMVVSRTSEHNAPVRRIWKALGGTEIVLPRMRGRDEDEIVTCLTVEAWRSGKFGRIQHG